MGRIWIPFEGRVRNLIQTSSNEHHHYDYRFVDVNEISVCSVLKDGSIQLNPKENGFIWCKRNVYAKRLN